MNEQNQLQQTTHQEPPWQVLIPVLLARMGVDKIVLTEADFAKVDPFGVITIEKQVDGLHLGVVSGEDAEQFREQHGLSP